MLVEAAIKTAKKRGYSEMQQHVIRSKGISETKVNELIDEYDLTSRKAQRQNPAREKSLGSCRLMSHWVVGFSALCRFLPSFKKWNSDQSMVGVKPAGAGLHVFICKEEEAIALENGIRLVVTTAEVLERNRNLLVIQFLLLCLLFYILLV